MDLIPFFQNILLIVAIIFAVVLIVSYVYSKFIKKDKEDEHINLPVNPGNNNAPDSGARKKTINYTSSADSQKLYVNTDEHRKHVVANKAASKPQRFKIINKTNGDEN